MNVKKLVMFCVVAGLILVAPNGAQAKFVVTEVTDSFETPWTGDYAPGWENCEYRHGDAPVAKMEQTTDHVYSGNYALKLSVTNAGTPEASTNWWGLVVQTEVDASALVKELNPWVSVMYYDPAPSGGLPGGWLSVIPDTDIPDDWTDVQHGTRWGREAHYWYGWASLSGFTYLESDVERTEGWHEFKVTLSPDGVLDFYIDGTKVGTSSRTDYKGLASLGIGVWFMDGEFNNSTVYFDDFKVGSNMIPEPATIALLGLGGLALLRKRRA